MNTDAFYNRILNNDDKHKISIADEKTCWTYYELRCQTMKALNILKDMGIKPYENIMLLADSRVEFVAYYLAIHLLNAVCIPYSLSVDASYINKLSRTLRCKIILDKEIYMNSKLDYENNEISTVENFFKEDIADILFTSGTTGIGKGVMISYRAINQAILNITEAILLDTNDCVLLPLPLHHSNALGSLRAILSNGATAVLTRGLVNISEIQRLIKLYKCTGLSCSPVMIDWLIHRFKANYEDVFKTLRYVEIGTAPLNSDSRKKIKEVFKDKQIFTNYGATEAPRAIYMDINSANKETALGHVVGDYDVKIFRDDNTFAFGYEEKGRLGLFSKALMTCYYNNEELTQKSNINGYFLTGDIAYVNSDNEVVLVGRESDLINVGGEKVYPCEIENLINKLDGVKEAICIGEEINRMMIGQRIVAFISTDGSVILSERQVKLYLKKHLENYKIPYKIIFIDNLPHNEIGKVDRKLLRLLFKDK